MTDFDAVSALLMLSSGMQRPIYPQQIRSASQQRQNGFGFYQDQFPLELVQNENLQKLPMQKELFPTSKRHLMPSQSENQISSGSFCAQKSMIDHTYADGLPLPSVHQSLPIPALEPWSGGNPREGLSNGVLFEFDRILRESSHQKDEFIRSKTEQFPIDAEYNPKKSRMSRSYKDPVEAAGRAKNNLASRRSRYKKKVQLQLLKLSTAFDREENRILYAQEKWLGDAISELESKLLAQGYDAMAIRNLRSRCGLK